MADESDKWKARRRELDVGKLSQELTLSDAERDRGLWCWHVMATTPSRGLSVMDGILFVIRAFCLGDWKSITEDGAGSLEDCRHPK